MSENFRSTIKRKTKIEGNRKEPEGEKKHESLPGGFGPWACPKNERESSDSSRLRSGMGGGLKRVLDFKKIRGQYRQMEPGDGIEKDQRTFGEGCAGGDARWGRWTSFLGQLLDVVEEIQGKGRIYIVRVKPGGGRLKKTARDGGRR